MKTGLVTAALAAVVVAAPSQPGPLQPAGQWVLRVVVPWHEIYDVPPANTPEQLAWISGGAGAHWPIVPPIHVYSGPGVRCTGPGGGPLIPWQPIEIYDLVP